MQVKSIAECSPWSIRQYFRPSLSYHLSIRFFVLSIFEWPLKTGFTVFCFLSKPNIPVGPDNANKNIISMCGKKFYQLQAGHKYFIAAVEFAIDLGLHVKAKLYS